MRLLRLTSTIIFFNSLENSSNRALKRSPNSCLTALQPLLFFLLLAHIMIQHFRSTLLVSLLLFSTIQLQGQTLNLVDSEQKYPLDKSVTLLFDTIYQNFEIEDITTPQIDAQFERNQQKYLNFGYVKHPIWVKFKVHNQTARTDWQLSLDITYLDTISFYKQTAAGTWEVQKAGWSEPFDSRGEIKSGSFYFPLNLQPDSVQTYYMRVSSINSIALPLSILPKYQAYQESQDWHFWYGLYGGAMLIMVFYNLFIFLTLRNLNYLFYTFTIFSTMVTFLTLGGYLYKYVYADYPILNHVIFRSSITLVIVTTSAFTIRFLQVKKYSKLLFYSLSSTAAIAVMALAYQLIAISGEVLNVVVRVQSPLLLITGIWCWKKGSKFARFFVLAWFFYVLGGFAITLRNSGAAPFNFWTTHGAEIGSLLEVMLISLALSDQYRIIKREQEKASEKLLEVEKEAKNTLEQRVEERTYQLNERNEELHQLNEEMQVTLETVQEQNYEIAKKNHEITSGINYAQRIQRAILPSDQLFEKCFPEYFTFFRPCQGVSGDFYFLLEKADKVFLAAVDCTGHGVPGALMSMVGYNLLREAILERQIHNPADILSWLNLAVINALQQRSTGNRDGMDLSICVVDRAKNELHFAAAKHSLIYKQNGQMHRLKGSRNSIGGQYFNQDHSFECHVLPLDGETCYYLHTDGYPDQFGGPYKRKFMQQPFRRLLNDISESPLPEQEKQLADTLDDWIKEGAEKQIDDILIIGFKA